MKLVIYILVLFVVFASPSWSQCPDDPEDLKIVSQEMEDRLLAQYPNCREFIIIKYNNRYIGKPTPTKYLLSFAALLIGCLVAMKAIFWAYDRRKAQKVADV